MTLHSGMKNSWFAVGTQFQAWDRLVRSESVDCASVSVEICFTIARGIPGSGSSARNSALLQSAQHYKKKKKKQMNNENTVLLYIIPTRKKCKMRHDFHSGTCHLKLVTPQLAVVILFDWVIRWWFRFVRVSATNWSHYFQNALRS